MSRSADHDGPTAASCPYCGEPKDRHEYASRTSCVLGAPKPPAATLLWHYENGSWWAESPEYPEWVGGADSLDEARLLAHGGLYLLGTSEVHDPFTMPLAQVTS